MPAAHAWILGHFTAFRVALFCCCAGYSAILYGWLRPSPEALRHGLLAILVQFWLGLWGDLACVAAGGWDYREMPFALHGIPLDLHADWSILWGLGLVWLSDRWPGRGRAFPAAALYLGAWTLLTLLFDAALAHWLLFLRGFSGHWWVADLAFLLTVQAATLWFYRSLFDERAFGLPALPPYGRSLVYVSMFVPFFFVWLPDRIADAAAGLGIRPAQLQLSGLPLVLAAAGAALGGWSIHEFARRGRGTPVPWDPPQELVETGPYGFTANPMQLSGLLLTAALFVDRLSWLTAIYLLDVLVVVGAVFDILEPRTLRERFGPAYASYRSQVRLFRVAAQPYLPPEELRPILLFDEGCGLCQALVAALVGSDRRQLWRIAPLQGAAARRLLPDSSGERLALVEPSLSGGPALQSFGARAVLRALGRGPLAIAWLGAWEGLPGACTVGDLVYAAVARRRARLGKPDPALLARLRTVPGYLP